jgi:hypothetical protein
LATLPPGTIVDLTEFAAEALRFPPPDGDLTVVVHPSALRARFDAHTQVAQFGDDGLAWLGALGEDMLVTLDEEPDPGARAPAPPASCAASACGRSCAPARSSSPTPRGRRRRSTAGATGARGSWSARPTWATSSPPR